MVNIVVVGATGHFGGRICRRLSRKSGIRLFVSSRRLSSAQAFADTLQTSSDSASVEAVELNHLSDSFSAELGKLKPEIVIHTAGPYQGQNYSVAKACLEQGCHYIDLADGRKFVRDFSQLNNEAVDKSLLLVAGASTLPGLSSAVVSTFAPKFSKIHSIQTTIAPAHQTPRGSGTVSAVLSYCGRPFSVLEDGQWQTRYGWQNLRKVKYPNLRLRYGGACDVPDLVLFPDIYQELKTATFHAALEAPWEQLSLWIMAAITRAGIIKDWTKFTSAFKSISKLLFSLGSVRGGMSIRISGIDLDGGEKSIDWYLVAGNNHGPEIPCTPAIVLVSKLMREELTVRGAKPCVSMFSLEDFAGERSLFCVSVSWA